MGSATREAIDRKARFAGNGPALVKRPNAASDAEKLTVPVNIKLKEY